MGGVWTAIAVGISAAATVYSAEEQRKVRSAADDRFRDEKNRIASERGYANKKKENQDVLASRKALQLRNKTIDGQVGTNSETKVDEINLGVLGT